MLSTKAGKEAYVEPVIEGRRLPLHGEGGQAEGCGGAKNGTKLARGELQCLMSGAPIAGDYIKAKARPGAWARG
jgi:putative DNA methylase